jgi:hypothetical protein
MEVVKNKRKTDKEVETKTVNIRITNDKKLVNEFLDAFKKDAADAEQAMFKKRKENNEINYYQCRFLDQTYTIIVKEEGNANVTVGSPSRFQLRQFSLDSLPSDRQKQMLGKQKERMEKQKERMKHQKERMKQHQGMMKQHQEKVMKQHKGQMKQHKERMKQYKLNELDSMLLKNSIIVDSLILKSSARLNSINWDSIASGFGKNMDSLAYKIGVGWDEILERYDFE